ncbi:PEP-CTERM sorting domain-containing protein [Marinobacter sp. CHS3-4]|uniref:PEP-CTERM sorting domain-containing protein n=1 Tax=Marinobacter sp. CHS3-4 TaxID=3045174 RepID=UPI0024B61EF3|nr:PEP-CTERM sorting domain-containing protein [Marinobacter sp. CHS3-4]MDI9246884.1 PEP-CTERM sorting domain-containing protein [Marinobacter sp. CHS3-4]
MDSLLKIVLATSMFALAANVSALPLTPYGSLDTLEAEGSPSPSDEETWIEGIIGEIDYTKYDYPGTWTTVVDGLNTYWALDFFAEQEIGAGLTEGPAYFLIKTGSGATGGSSGTSDTFLFKNNDSLQYAFINPELLGVSSTSNVEVISHFGATGPGTTVPEPGTIALMMVGLSGLFVARRRKASA